MVMQHYRTLKTFKYLVNRIESLICRKQLSNYTAAVTSFIKKNEVFWAYQQSLPRLPVPPLQSSLDLYLHSIQPYLSEEEYAESLRIVKKFGSPSGLGEKLHKLLEEKAHTTDNWLDDWWLCAYLDCRLPLVGNSTPAATAYYEELSTLGDQLKIAARFVAAVLDFKNLIDNFKMPFEKLGDHPLDMSQVFNLFYTCRVPKIPRDTIEFHGLGRHTPKHIVLAHNNHFFRIDVYDEKNEVLTEDQLLIQFKKAVSHSQISTLPVGALTTLHRDKWTKTYCSLKKCSPINEESLNNIQKALFIVCLDKPLACPTEQNRTKFALQTLHGFGANENGGNRWYEKAKQFVIGNNGCIGFVTEHTGIDGTFLISMTRYIKKYLMKIQEKQWTLSEDVPEPKRLQFTLSSDILQDIKEAEENLENIVKNIDALCFEFEDYDNEFIKYQKLSPDSFIQMAIQLAFYKIHHSTAAAYESAATRRFLNGRTETIRSTSIESVHFCQTMVDKLSVPSAKIAALKEAVAYHKKYAIRAVRGLGIDRLLLALNKIAEENGIVTPDLFLDPGYTRSTYFKLSTSQVSEMVNCFAIFGPVVFDGYGCWYDSSSMRFGVTSLNCCRSTATANDFKNALSESLTEMRDLLMDESLN